MKPPAATTGSTPPTGEAFLRRRTLLLGAAQLAGFGLIAGRLYQLQVAEAGRFATLADANRFTTRLLAPRRGRILDRAGRVLASNRTVYRLSLVPSLAVDVPAAITAVAQLLPRHQFDRERLLLRVRRSPPHLPILLADELSFEDVAILGVNAPSLPGLVTEEATRRQYHYGTATSHVVGYVGSHDRPALDDPPILRLAGVRTGKAGVELAADEQLRGKPGQIRQEVDARGRMVREVDRQEPTPGRDVTVTIDIDLQAEVTRRLGRVRRAAAAVVDVHSGEVAMLASVPSFDQNTIENAGSRSAQARLAWRRLITSPEHPLFDRTTSGLYPPGSTFKMVTALAALQAGSVDTKERLDCSGTYSFGGHTYRCWRRSGHGRCDLHRAIRESCDCYFYEIARRTGIEHIAAMARRLGMGQTVVEGLAIERAGVLPTPDWKWSTLGRSWLGGETLLSGIGQGYVLATPIQLAVMTARLATGRAVRAKLVRSASPDIRSTAFEEIGIDRLHLEAVQRAMAAVVGEDGGTGGNVRLERGDLRIAGKTGTSQVTRRSADVSSTELPWHERDHALFVAYFPVAQPRYALACVAEHAGGGGSAAAPIARDIIQAMVDRGYLVTPSAAGGNQTGQEG